MELNQPRPQEEQFLRTSGTPYIGCRGFNVCEPDPCENRGVCEDMFDRFKCHCPSDWAGQRCEFSCRWLCIKPMCSRSLQRDLRWYECSCDAGYTGRRCERRWTYAPTTSAAMGGTCLRGLKRYSCLCPRGMTGPFCRWICFPWSSLTLQYKGALMASMEEPWTSIEPFKCRKGWKKVL